MRARIDITEVEASTKIRAKYLRALENEEWDLLPGPVFVKSFLRTYGDYLGLDSRLLVDEFKRRSERHDAHDQRAAGARARERERERPARTQRPPRTPGPAGGPLIPPWALISVVLVGVVVALYLDGKNSGGGRNTTPPPASRTDIHHRHRTNGGATTRNSGTTTPTTPRTTAQRTTTTPPAPSTASLQITPTTIVWICVERVEHGTATPVFAARDFTAGETVPTATGKVLLVNLGNAGATVTANGKRYPLASSSTAIGLKVTPAGVTTLAAGTEPTCAPG